MWQIAPLNTMSGLIWKNLINHYHCPIPDCDGQMHEIQGVHACMKCPYRISEEKISNIMVIPNRKLEPPQFIKDMKGNNPV